MQAAGAPAHKGRMQINAVELFAQMTQKMDYLSTRHQILAQNVANADTPQAKTRDLKPFSEALSEAGGAQVARTHPAHLSGAAASAEYREDRSTNGWEMSPSGNDIVLEEEMMKTSGVMRDYQLMSSLMQRHVSMMRLALQTRS